MELLFRKQRELLDVALGISHGLTTSGVIRTAEIHPAAVVKYLRTLAHLQLTREELRQLAASTPPAELPGVLLKLFVERKVESRKRRKAARKAKGGGA